MVWYTQYTIKNEKVKRREKKKKAKQGIRHYNQIRALNVCIFWNISLYIEWTTIHKACSTLAAYRTFRLFAHFVRSNKTLTDFCFSCLRVSSQIGVLFISIVLHFDSVNLEYIFSGSHNLLNRTFKWKKCSKWMWFLYVPSLYLSRSFFLLSAKAEHDRFTLILVYWSIWHNWVNVNTYRNPVALNNLLSNRLIIAI